MNFLKKFIFPMKDCNSLRFLRWLIFNMPSILLGSTLIPSSESMWPRSFPSWRPKSVFLGFKDKPYFLHFSKTFLKWIKFYLSVLEKIVISCNSLWGASFREVLYCCRAYSFFFGSTFKLPKSSSHNNCEPWSVITSVDLSSIEIS